MLDQELETRIAAWLREQWGVEEEGGCFYTELFADYRDELDKRDLQAIAGSDDPREAFWDWLDNAYNEAVDQAWFDLASQCSDDLEIERETAWEFLTEMVEVRLPEQHFLDQEIHVDILVDTGDANYDFICNNIAPAWGGCDPDEAHAEASIFWLAGQQGYCKDYVIAALKGEETRSAFLESLVREVENEASSINVLTFLCTMTLGQWIEVRENWMRAEATRARCGSRRMPCAGCSIHGAEAGRRWIWNWSMTWCCRWSWCTKSRRTCACTGTGWMKCTG